LLALSMLRVSCCLQTLENTREPDVTWVAEGDEEVALDEADDEFAGAVCWGGGGGARAMARCSGQCNRVAWPSLSQQQQQQQHQAPALFMRSLVLLLLSCCVPPCSALCA
jgi:hypothetical protein